MLTGDTLFIGDVGRPDLAGSAGFTAEQMASMLYDSLHGKLLKLPDATAVYPAHGAGSLCGRNISKETSSTIGHERRTNYALQPMSKPDFVELATADLPEVPQYFAKDVAINREGAPPLAGRPLPPRAHAGRGRGAPARRRAGPRRALGRGLRRGPRAGLLEHRARRPVRILGGLAARPAARPIVIVAEDEGGVAEAALRLARVGLENVTGYLAGGILAWFDAGRALATLPQWPVDELQRAARTPAPRRCRCSTCGGRASTRAATCRAPSTSRSTGSRSTRRRSTARARSPSSARAATGRASRAACSRA